MLDMACRHLRPFGVVRDQDDRDRRRHGAILRTCYLRFKPIHCPQRNDLHPFAAQCTRRASILLPVSTAEESPWLASPSRIASTRSTTDLIWSLWPATA